MKNTTNINNLTLEDIVGLSLTIYILEVRGEEAPKDLKRIIHQITKEINKL